MPQKTHRSRARRSSRAVARVRFRRPVRCFPAQRQTAEEAGQGVVHGSFRWTTAGDLRAGGGTVEPAPEFNEGVGQTNYQHADVCLGEGPVNGAT